MVGYDVAVVRKLFVADRTLFVLFNNLLVQEFPHLCWRPEFSISPRVMRVDYALDPQPHSAFLAELLPPAAEKRICESDTVHCDGASSHTSLLQVMSGVPDRKIRSDRLVDTDMVRSISEEVRAAPLANVVSNAKKGLAFSRVRPVTLW